MNSHELQLVDHVLAKF